MIRIQMENSRTNYRKSPAANIESPDWLLQGTMKRLLVIATAKMAMWPPHDNSPLNTLTQREHLPLTEYPNDHCEDMLTPSYQSILIYSPFRLCESVPAKLGRSAATTFGGAVTRAAKFNLTASNIQMINPKKIEICH